MGLGLLSLARTLFRNHTAHISVTYNAETNRLIIPLRPSAGGGLACSADPWRRSVILDMQAMISYNSCAWFTNVKRRYCLKTTAAKDP